MKQILRVLCLLCMPLLFSCSKKDKQPQDCPPDLMCTMEYRTITITITGTNGVPVRLDKYRTVRLSDNKAFDLQTAAGNWEDSTWQATGTYPVLTDGQQKEISTSGELFEFQGEQNNTIVIREQYRIKDNCCHVELLSGKTEVISE